MKKVFKISAIVMAVVTVLAVFSFFTFQREIAAYTASLKQGSSGQEVKDIQQKLKDMGYYTSAVDGVYGSKTVEAVKKFQKAKGLTADGIVGSQTLSALGITNKSSAVSAAKFSNKDLDLLARTIHAEARGEPYIGQVAVGAVILNRIKSSQFPNTLSGVIYQPWAFTCVNDGQISLAANESCKKAAQDALNGWDPTYGCLYYYNPRIATNKWIFGRQTVTTIGRHVFAV